MSPLLPMPKAAPFFGMLVLTRSSGPDTHTGAINCPHNQSTSSGAGTGTAGAKAWRRYSRPAAHGKFIGHSSACRRSRASAMGHRSRARQAGIPLMALSIDLCCAFRRRRSGRLGGEPPKMTKATPYRYSLRNSRSSSPVSASAFAGRIEASRSSTSSLNAAAIFATWMPKVPRNSPSALPNVQL